MSEHHIVPPKVYATILGCLMLLMGATIFAATIHIGPPGAHIYNLLLALFIAFCKMMLIILFFMHVKYGSSLTKVFAGAGFFWLLIFISLLMADYVGRVLGDSPFSASPYGG